MPLKKYRNQNNSKEDFKYLKPIFQMRTRPSSYNLMKGIIFLGLLTVIAVSGALIFTMKDSKSSDIKMQKTDIEFKISADKPT
ncbi:hypothetical protein [Acinetobacter lwoffii]|uniref:hypothetical protein n=1 Tax=Acinetobacter lwoffii TaxID=28090 RepID=UPI002DB69CED|nr:hypothetical protein [Acinetobacter lwoffii]MEB6680135.1 hypothetical protein [Acinetobacter lwoffii]